SKWAPAADNNAGGTVTSITMGAGFTGPPIVTTGTISIAPMGVTSAMLAGGITNSQLVNSSMTVVAGAGLTVNGSPVALGGTVTLSNSGLLSLTANAPIMANGGQNPT